MAAAGKGIKKRKAVAMLDEARLRLQAGQLSRAEELLRDVVFRSELDEPQAAALLSDALEAGQRAAESRVILEEALRRHPSNAELLLRLGTAKVGAGEVTEGLLLLERLRARMARNPAFLGQFGFALVKAGRLEEAEVVLTGAVATGAPESRLVLALLRGRQGRFDEAERIATEVLKVAKAPALVVKARGLVADARMFLGDHAGAVRAWSELRASGTLDPAQLPHFAYAAQMADERALCDELVAERLKCRPTDDDLVLFAQIANLRREPSAALEYLAKVEPGAAHGAPSAGRGFEWLATRGRALLLLDRRAEARAELEAAAGLPEYGSPRQGPGVRVDLARLEVHEGRSERARALIEEALALDPHDPEARAEQAALGAGREVSAVSQGAEVEAMRRRFIARETEVESLRQELSRVREAKAEAERKFRQAEEKARKATENAARSAQEGARRELAARELEMEEKAGQNVALALDGAPDCPAAVRNLVQVAERTFQTALYTELPAAAVAVLFSGALERALFVLFVERFDEWLGQGPARDRFLEGAVRERRGRRVDYFDHFIEAFDRERAGRAPSMGEIGRALSKRGEPYLSPFAEYLEQRVCLPPAFLDQLVEFVSWSKERLRNPAAHGRAIELGYEELRRFRERLLFSFEPGEPGLLALLFREG